MTALYFEDFASFFATRGISKAPGTQTTSMFSSSTPCLFSASTHPSSSFEPIKSLNLAITIAYLSS